MIKLIIKYIIYFIISIYFIYVFDIIFGFLSFFFCSRGGPKQQQKHQSQQY